MNAEYESKETEVLFFDSQLRHFDPRKNYHINCITGHVTDELEVHFLERHLVAILTQDRFLVAINIKDFIPSTATPEIFFLNFVQQINNGYALWTLKHVDCCIDKRNELTSGHRRSYFNAGIRR